MTQTKAAETTNSNTTLGRGANFSFGAAKILRLAIEEFYQNSIALIADSTSVRYLSPYFPHKFNVLVTHSPHILSESTADVDNEVSGMGRDWIDDRAAQMAQDLDRGNGERVADALRQDAMQMNQRDFMQLVRQTQRYDRDGIGDDLKVTAIQGYHGVEQHVSINMRERDQYGRPVIYSEPVVKVEPPQPRPGHQPNDRRGIDPASVLLGTAIGVGITILQNNHNRHHDNRRR